MPRWPAAGVGLGGDEKHVGVERIGDEHLLARKDPTVAVRVAVVWMPATLLPAAGSVTPNAADFATGDQVARDSGRFRGIGAKADQVRHGDFIVRAKAHADAAHGPWKAPRPSRSPSGSRRRCRPTPRRALGRRTPARRRARTAILGNRSCCFPGVGMRVDLALDELAHHAAELLVLGLEQQMLGDVGRGDRLHGISLRGVRLGCIITAVGPRAVK